MPSSSGTRPKNLMNILPVCLTDMWTGQSLNVKVAPAQYLSRGSGLRGKCANKSKDKGCVGRKCLSIITPVYINIRMQHVVDI